MATNITDPLNTYICGPWYGANTNERFAEFLKVSGMIRELGYSPFFPAFFGTYGDIPYEEYLKDTLGKLLLCRYIYLMRGWQDNYAATLEYVIARHAGIQVLCDEGEFPRELDPCFPPVRRDVRTKEAGYGVKIKVGIEFPTHHGEDNATFMDYYFRHVLLPAERGSDTDTHAK